MRFILFLGLYMAFITPSHAVMFRHHNPHPKTFAEKISDYMHLSPVKAIRTAIRAKSADIVDPDVSKHVIIAGIVCVVLGITGLLFTISTINNNSLDSGLTLAAVAFCAVLGIVGVIMILYGLIARKKDLPMSWPR